MTKPYVHVPGGPGNLQPYFVHKDSIQALAKSIQPVLRMLYHPLKWHVVRRFVNLTISGVRVAVKSRFTHGFINSIMYNAGLVLSI